MSYSNLKQDVLDDASAGLARSIVEIHAIWTDIKFTEPLAATRLTQQINRLKAALKNVEKLRLLEEEQTNSNAVSVSSTYYSLLSNSLNKSAP